MEEVINTIILVIIIIIIMFSEQALILSLCDSYVLSSLSLLGYNGHSTI